MVMFPIHQAWPKPSCKAQWKGEEDEADRGRSGKTTSGNGQARSSPSSRRQCRTGENGGNWLQNHLWCPINPRGWGIDEMRFIHCTNTDIFIHSRHPHRYVQSFTTPTQIHPFFHHTHTDTSLGHYTKTPYSFTTPTQSFIHALHPHRVSFIHHTHTETFVHSLHLKKKTLHSCTTPSQIPSVIHYTLRNLHLFITPTQIPSLGHYTHTTLNWPATGKTRRGWMKRPLACCSLWISWSQSLHQPLEQSVDKIQISV